MQFLTRLFVDHSFDEWASDQTLLAARVLNQAAADLILQTEEDLTKAGWKDGLVDPNAFLREKIAPRIRAVGEPLALMLIEDANEALQSLANERALWSRNIEDAPVHGNSFEGAGDIAATAIPLGAGAAAAAALPYLAISSTSAYFGFVTTTAISWPIVVGGGAIAALGIATGIIEGSRLWSKLEARLRRKSRELIISALLRGTAQRPSILEQLESEYRQTAERARSIA
ncbi:hypothetical protein GCM10010923_03730 [Blastomonas marina]|uniref:Uncharacterized protein n=1 Tax=Blastomonas marina TaxID=1867408 RepID=A0ABQ1F3D0_9SPHN|nr:hypothetical protein [Blastomonas marina]GFZ98759.1 hypothetical protein GCM10010923_03730 [Blastomonas marina]